MSDLTDFRIDFRPPWYGNPEGQAMFDTLVMAGTCYLCDADNPYANPEDCPECGPKEAAADAELAARLADAGGGPQ